MGYLPKTSSDGFKGRTPTIQCHHGDEELLALLEKELREYELFAENYDGDPPCPNVLSRTQGGIEALRSVLKAYTE